MSSVEQIFDKSDVAGEDRDFLALTTRIVSAYVSANALPTALVPALISQVHGALVSLVTPRSKVVPVVLAPAVTVKKSVTPDFLICLEDGKRFKSLKRHLATNYDMTPDQYRAKWGLPADYPMVAPNYSITRSLLAKSSGLGKSKPAAKEEAVTTPRRKIGLKFG